MRCRQWVGVIHLPPLPGSPHACLTPESIVRYGLEEARVLCQAGAAAVLIENLGDRPYFRTRVPPITLTVMTRVAATVRSELAVRVGINVLRNDAIGALAVAIAAGADFIRVNVLTGAVVADQGLISGVAARLMRYRRYWQGEHVAVWADLRVKHAQPLAEREWTAELGDLIERAGADAVIVTGVRTGVAPTVQWVQAVRSEMPESVPLWLGSGVTPENLAQFVPWVDGVIVSSALRVSGRAGAPLDRQRIDQWVRAWQRVIVSSDASSATPG